MFNHRAYLASTCLTACLLVACGGQSSSSSSTTTPVGSGSGNSAPTVDAGPDQTAQEGTTVSLSATASDADGDTLSYRWSQTSGPSVTFSNASVANPTFTAPDVSSDMDVVLSVTVSDGSANTSDSVTITVTDVGSGGGGNVTGEDVDQVSAPGLTVTLQSGASSNDTVSWTQTGGTAVTLSNMSAVSPTFTVPALTLSETLKFEVTVGNITEMRDVFVLVHPGYGTSLGQTIFANHTDEQQWACDVDPGTTNTVVSDSGAFRSIAGNGIPGHLVGTFPNNENPTAISSVSVNQQVTTSPSKTNVATEMAQFGILLNGMLLERDTAETYGGSGGGTWNYEAITPGTAQGNSLGDDNNRAVMNGWLGTDCNNSHVQPNGLYHAHGLPEAFLQQLMGDSPTDMVLAGYAADGFPIYLRYGYADPSDTTSGLKIIEHSWELRSGVRADGPGGAYDGTFRQDWEYVANSGDTDECGGRTGPTPEYPNGTYHYFLTDDYPYIPRCIFGTPDSGFRQLGQGGGGGR